MGVMFPYPPVTPSKMTCVGYLRHYDKTQREACAAAILGP